MLSHFREAIDDAPYDVQRRFVDRLRERGVLVGESVREHFTPALIPIGGPLRQTGRGRVLLAGDAGGFVSAVTAEGIYCAMVTGDLAARAIRIGPSVSKLESTAGLAITKLARNCETRYGFSDTSSPTAAGLHGSSTARIVKQRPSISSSIS